MVEKQDMWHMEFQNPRCQQPAGHNPPPSIPPLLSLSLSPLPPPSLPLDSVLSLPLPPGLIGPPVIVIIYSERVFFSLLLDHLAGQLHTLGFPGNPLRELLEACFWNKPEPETL